MRKLSLICIGIFFLNIAFAEAKKISQIDDTGQTLNLTAPAKRVISLAPSLTEMVYEVGAGNTLVGAVMFSDYPEKAKQLPRVGSYERLDMERIVELKPDLILAWHHGNTPHELTQLSNLGIPVFRLEPKHIADIPEAIERIGALLGHPEQAHARAEKFRQETLSLASKYDKVNKVRVFYQVWKDPLITINNDSIISDMMHLCGGENIFGKEPMLTPYISTESVLTANPQIIIASHVGINQSIMPIRSPQAADFKNWLRFKSMSAVQNQQLWILNADWVSRAGPRSIEGAKSFCFALNAAREANKK